MSAISRPTAVTVIGWLSIVLGALMVVSGVFAIALSLAFPSSPPTPAPPAAASAPLAFMSLVFRYFWVVSTFQAVLGAVMIGAGAGFLRLRSWSRPVLEAFSWAALVYDVAFGAYWLWNVAGFAFRAGSPSQPFLVVMLCFGSFMILAFMVPPVLAIRSLRGHVVRQALAAACA